MIDVFPHVLHAGSPAAALWQGAKNFARDFPERAKLVAFYRIGSTHGRSK
ncbi:hypothetical protein [Burkholderia metallica]